MFFINPAIALDVAKYEELKETSVDVLKIHIDGVQQGYSWSNTFLEARGDKVFYCQPRKMVLNVENSINIIDSKIAKLKKSGQVEMPPVELILFYGLVDTFPCSK